jgi:putative glutamine amidotransferase
MPEPNSTRRPLVAVMGDAQQVGEQPRFTADAIPVLAAARSLDAIPLVVPPVGAELALEDLLAQVDGLYVPGGLTNVHPSRYGAEESHASGPYDPMRDETVLPLIRAAIAAGVPTLMTCRGLQELVVAFGGSLAEESAKPSEAQRHGTPKSAKTEEERYALRHEARIEPGGVLAALASEGTARVNSLHSQLVERLPPGLRVEATALDGTVEAVSVEGASAFALGVIWHPEYWAEVDPLSQAIMGAFRAAVWERARGR